MILNKLQPYKHQTNGHFSYEAITPLAGHIGLFCAVDKDDGTLVILKRYKGSDSQIQERFIREATLTCEMRHDHIVTGLCWGEDAQGIWLAMEREEESLTQYIAQNNLTFREMISIIEQVAQGLLYLESTGLIASHRDIKPDNILVSKTGVIKISDLGIVLEAGEAGKNDPARIAGTYAYMAPEQRVNPNSATFKSDVYSLGCVYYEMVSGKNPCSALSPQEIRDFHGQKTPRPLSSDVPKQTRKLIQSMMSKDPRKRPKLSYLAHLRKNSRIQTAKRVLGSTTILSLSLLGMWHTGLLTLLVLVLS